MGISGRHWLFAALGALALHVLALLGVWLAHTPVHAPQNTPRGVMVKLDNLNAGPPPPASIENMPIENVAPNNTVGNVPEASAPSPGATEAPASAAPQAASTVGPEPSNQASTAAPQAAPTVGPEEPGGPAPANPAGAAGGPANADTAPGGENAVVPAIASAVTIHPSDTLEDIHPQQQVTARQAKLNAPGTKNATRNQQHNGAYGNSEQATDDYIVRLRGWLSRHKQYPRAARQNKVQGTVRLYLVVDRSGHVLSHRIAKSSGSKLLDHAAEQMLAHSEPLPTMPGAMQRNRLELVVPIVFTLK